jgi:hypothetical protein
MRENIALSTGKSSKQTQHVSASLCGCAGLVDDDPADEEDDDFEVELEAVDVVSCALAVVSLAFKALEFEFESIRRQRFNGSGQSILFILVKWGGKSPPEVSLILELEQTNKHFSLD